MSLPVQKQLQAAGQSCVVPDLAKSLPGREGEPLFLKSESQALRAERDPVRPWRPDEPIGDSFARGTWLVVQWNGDVVTCCTDSEGYTKTANVFATSIEGCGRATCSRSAGRTCSRAGSSTCAPAAKASSNAPAGTDRSHLGRTSSFLAPASSSIRTISASPRSTATRSGGGPGERYQSPAPTVPLAFTSAPAAIKS